MAEHQPERAGQLSREELRTELERAREQIAELEADRWRSHERLIDSLAQHLQDGFVLLTPAGVHLDVNPAFCAMTGFTREELVGVGMPHPYWPAEDREAIEDVLRRHLEGATDRVEVTFMRKDGERFPVLITPSLMRGDDDRPFCIFATIKDISEQRRAEAELRLAEVRNARAQEIGRVGSWEYDPKTQRFWGSREARRISGLDLDQSSFSAEELAKTMRDPTTVFRALRDLLEGGKALDLEYEVFTDSPEPRIVWSGAEVRRDARGEPLAVTGVIQDISADKRAEAALRRSNRELQALTTCNQALLRATDESELLHEICRIVCDEAGYHMAWVGYAEHDEAKTVRPVAWAGPAREYLASADIVWADSERGRGPTGTAIRSGETVWLQDFTSDPRVAPWRESAARIGLRSSIALPLKGEDARPFGALLVYSSGPDAFTAREVRLLEELAADLAFGITALRTRDERQRAEQSLRESEEKYRRLFDDAEVGMFRTRLDGSEMLDVNPRFLEIFGRTRDEVLGAPSVIHWADPRDREEMVRVLEAEGHINDFECRLLTKQGEVRTCLTSLSLDRESGILEGSIADISERKRAEKALLASDARLRRALGDTVTALGATVAMRDPYTARHERRVAGLACRIAERLAWSKEAIETLRTAALVHDVGKIAVPAEMLSKPTRLTETEFELIKAHSEAAYEILAPIEFDGPVAEIVYQHHERLDGSGYPRGLRGQEILAGACVLAVADVVEAMITHRPYRAALTLEEALAEIGPDSRGRFDAEAAEVCRRLFMEEGYELPD